MVNNCIASLLETCVSIDGVALKGQEFRWVQASGDEPADVSSCRYTSTATHFISQEIPLNGEPQAICEKFRVGSTFVFFRIPAECDWILEFSMYRWKC